LDQINLVARDMAKSAAFYQRLGVAFPHAPADGDEPFHMGGDTGGGMDLDLDSAAFAQVWNQGWKGQDRLAGRVVIGFAVDTREDVDRLYADLTSRGHPGLQPPYDAFWGARYAVVEDPDGIAVGLMSPIDPARKVWPPQGWPANG
jgi:predicted lactoylglutathione lyase